MSNLGLDPERLTSLDDLGHKKKIIPAEVRGYFRRHRDWTQIVLLLIFLILPWIKIHGHQAVLLDIHRREFGIFGMMFYAHDAPLIFFILAFATVGLALTTAIWGRIWCGWACPQTVFIDAVYRRIERWVEGPYLKRRELERAPLSAQKLTVRSVKWFLFFLVSSIIAHSFVAYFVGSDRLMEMIEGGPNANLWYFIMISGMTAILLFDFAWFREQFCVIMCPYGRFQSVLMDQTSLAVLYDTNRGEPRKGAAVDGQKAGDCVACQRCVQVCPTGIDIRKGLQMECIACSSCIDACDEIMEKVKKPKGLIRYANIQGAPLTWKKPRTFVYGGVLLVALIGFVWALTARQPLHFALLRGKDTPYTEITNAAGQTQILNHLKIHLKNQTAEPRTYEMSVLDEGTRTATTELTLVSPENPVKLQGKENKTLHVFVQIDPKVFAGKSEKRILFQLKSVEDPQDLNWQQYRLLGPSR